MKRILTILVLLCAVLNMHALAYIYGRSYYGFTEFTDNANHPYITRGTVTVQYKKKTIILDSAYITTKGECSFLNIDNESWTIIVKGKCRMFSSLGCPIINASDSNLRIYGDGEDAYLEMETANPLGDPCNCIYTRGGNLTIENLDVNITSYTDYAILNGKFEIAGTTFGAGASLTLRAVKGNLTSTSHGAVKGFDNLTLDNCHIANPDNCILSNNTFMEKDRPYVRWNVELDSDGYPDLQLTVMGTKVDMYNYDNIHPKYGNQSGYAVSYNPTTHTLRFPNTTLEGYAGPIIDLPSGMEECNIEFAGTCNFIGCTYLLNSGCKNVKISGSSPSATVVNVKDAKGGIIWSNCNLDVSNITLTGNTTGEPIAGLMKGDVVWPKVAFDNANIDIQTSGNSSAVKDITTFSLKNSYIATTLRDISITMKPTHYDESKHALVDGKGQISKSLIIRPGYGIRVLGEDLTPEKTSIEVGGGTISYSDALKRLTIDNVNITESETRKNILELYRDAETIIRFRHNNVLSHTGNGEGIIGFNTGKVRFIPYSRDATLDVSSSGETYSAIALYAAKSVVIEKSSNLTAKMNGAAGYAIYVPNGSLTINEANVAADGGGKASILAQSLSLTDCSVVKPAGGVVRNGTVVDSRGYAVTSEVLISNGTTGIEGVSTDNVANDAPAYDLTGRKVNGNYRGIVIKNGKKMIMK